MSISASSNCPICNNDEGFEEGEKVDVGWGSGAYGVKVGPDYCQVCGYVEGELNFDHFQKCWELQIDPYPSQPISKLGEFNPKYQAYFMDKKEAYGDCYNQCIKMVKAFPELRIVYGQYIDWVWGGREHFWCVDKNDVIVDPTGSQFPSQSKIYLPRKYVSIEELEFRLNANISSIF